MKILVTAGSTRTMIDKVRCITNIFKGNTGYNIAKHLSKEHEVTILTSNKEHLKDFNLTTWGYNTYDELKENMEKLITTMDYDVIIHSAAVSDYQVDGSYEKNLSYTTGLDLKKIDSNSKIGSDHDELFLRLIPTEKLIDKIKTEWGFKGLLVKFKLQVDMETEELLEIAYQSMKHSDADIIVANCLEWAKDKAYIIYDDIKTDVTVSVNRNRLPDILEKIIDIKRIPIHQRKAENLIVNKLASEISDFTNWEYKCECNQILDFETTEEDNK